MTSAAHIEALLKERIGLDAATVGPGMVERAVRERLAAAAAPDHHAYWNLLHSHPDELQSLIEAVVVPETWFFRHREALLALGRFAAMRVFGNDRAPDGGAPLRILSAPCSTGEEPYSIAMALLDAGVPEHRFQVDAVDVSARSLERARIAQYGTNSFRGTPLDFRDRHFTACAGGYALKANVRGKVRLVHGNLLDPGLMANEPPYHFVFCRNLLIYFDPPTQRRSLKMLERLSRPDATLFVGPAEASLLTRHGFVSAGVPLAFAFTRRSAHHAGGDDPAMPLYPAQPAHPMHVSAPAGAAPRQWPQPPRPPAARGQARPAGVLAPFAPPPAAPATDKAAERAKASANALSGISRLADRGELAAAVTACVAHLDAQGPSAAGYCLLGVLYDATGRPCDAREAYRRALYPRPGSPGGALPYGRHPGSARRRRGRGPLRNRAQRKTPIRHG
ncbi:chemotaxis protein CheR [Cupriavidus basilensis OR16]|uniref:Chemotaxis protein CheR n=1 Tax=Cupriavidus basilensis OR16 TaxID=1127483 RepID=H1S0T1_9BURK|nr:chemotaxis protein CheR [Cupriavidus basilensis OR16]